MRECLSTHLPTYVLFQLTEIDQSWLLLLKLFSSKLKTIFLLSPNMQQSRSFSPSLTSVIKLSDLIPYSQLFKDHSDYLFDQNCPKYWQLFVQFFFILMKTAVAISGQLLHRYCVTFSSNFWSPCLTRIHPPTLSASNHTPIRPVPQTHTPTWTILTLPSGQEKTLLNLKRRRLKRSESLHLHC